MPTSRRNSKLTSKYSVYLSNSKNITSEYAVATPNYGYVIPGENSDNWESALNSNLDKIDSNLKTNYDAAVENAVSSGLLQESESYNLLVNPEFKVWESTSNSVHINGSGVDYSCIGWIFVVGSTSDTYARYFSLESINVRNANYGISYYSPTLTPTNTEISTYIERAKTLRNKTLTFTFYASCSSNNTCAIDAVIDDGTETTTGFTTLNSNLSKMTITKTISSSATYVKVAMRPYTTSDGYIYITDPILVVGNFTNGKDYKPIDPFIEDLKTNRYTTVFRVEDPGAYIASNKSCDKPFLIFPKCDLDRNGTTPTINKSISAMSGGSDIDASVYNATYEGSVIYSAYNINTLIRRDGIYPSQKIVITSRFV